MLSNPDLPSSGSKLKLFFTEREQLSSVHFGPSPSHYLSIVLVSQIPARMQTDAYRFETREYSLCVIRLGSLLQPQKETRYKASEKYRSQTH